MLVDASAFPAIALWQGLLYIGVGVWAIFLFKTPSSKAKRIKWLCLALFIYAIGSLILCFKLFQ